MPHPQQSDISWSLNNLSITFENDLTHVLNSEKDVFELETLAYYQTFFFKTRRRTKTILKSRPNISLFLLACCLRLALALACLLAWWIILTVYPTVIANFQSCVIRFSLHYHTTDVPHKYCKIYCKNIHGSTKTAPKLALLLAAARIQRGRIGRCYASAWLNVIGYTSVRGAGGGYSEKSYNFSKITMH